MQEDERKHVAEILLVEDSSADTRLIREAFREVAVPHHLSVAETGRAALRHLHRESDFKDAPRPDFILLDLTLPDIHGFEVLSAIKSDTSLRRIPTVVFSSSQDPEEVVKAYSLNANSYIAKPVELADFIRVVKGVEDFWLTVVKLPKD